MRKATIPALAALLLCSCQAEAPVESLAFPYEGQLILDCERGGGAWDFAFPGPGLITRRDGDWIAYHRRPDGQISIIIVAANEYCRVVVSEDQLPARLTAQIP